jgi:PAS domain S-box-containing protein
MDMPYRSTMRALTGGKRRGTSILVLFALVVTGAILLLSSDAWRAINGLAVANSDSSQWTLAQAEVEFLGFKIALKSAGNGTSEMQAVRQRFDVFFSRMQIVLSGSATSGIRQSPVARERISSVTSFLESTVPLVDGPDAELRAAIPRLLDEAETIRGDLRVISLEGVRSFSERSADYRTRAANALKRLAALTGLLVIALAGGLFGLGYLFRHSRSETLKRATATSRMKSVISTSLDAIIVASSEGTVLEFNGAAESMFGFTRKEAVGLQISELIVPPHLRAAHDAGLERARLGGERRVTGRGRIRLEACDNTGRSFPVELSISEVHHDAGNMFVSYLRDITETVASERELVEARDKAVAGEKAKANLLAVMSHEMRTPLNGLLGTLELLQSSGLSPEQAEYSQIMQRSGMILLHHVNDVLDISRIDAGRIEIAARPFVPERVITDLIEEQSESAHIRSNELYAEITSAPLGPVLGDELRIRQILLNLMGNAIKFTRQGTVTVGLDFDLDQELLTFSVSDTGIGITPENTDRVFQDFVTLDASYNRSAEGTGLGLGIVKRLVEAMDGEIGVDSKPGEGSSFWFRIPAARARHAGRSASLGTVEGTTSAPVTGLNVLVVEDNQINRRVVSEMLRKHGAKVIEAHDGLEGVRAANATPYDLIFMDISMPGLDGVEATRRIRSGNGRNAKTPIVALTAHALPEDLENFREAGMDSTITKPISQAQITAALARVSPAQDETPPVAEEVPLEEEAPPLIDEDTLGDLREALGRDLFQNMHRQFLDETSASITDLRAADLAQTELVAYADQVHKLAGSAAVFGALRMRDALLAHETEAKAGTRATLEEGRAAICAAWTLTRDALDATVS